jgi:hypothetical protein
MVDLGDRSYISIADDLTNQHIDVSNAFSLTDGVVYANSDVMSQTNLQLNCKVTNNSDRHIKDFLNNSFDKYKVKVNVNGIELVCFVEVGGQTSAINSLAFKDYQITLKMCTRWLEQTIYKGEYVDPDLLSTPIRNRDNDPNLDVYNVGHYDNLEGESPTPLHYDRVTNFNTGIHIAFDNHYRNNYYFMVDGIQPGNTSSGLLIKVNGETVQCEFGGKGNLIQYSNVPSLMYTRNNKRYEPNLLPLQESNTSNFIFNILENGNSIYIDGLSSMVVYLYRSVRVI